MNSNLLEELLAVDQEELIRADEWAKVERGLGTPLPRGYKLLVERFGPQCFAGEIQLLSPFTTRKGLQLVKDGLRMLEGLEQSIEGLDGFSLFPYRVQPGGLLPWAFGSGGATLFFVMTGQPEHWPILLLMARGQDFEVKFHRSPAVLIYQYCSGSLASHILPGMKSNGEDA